MSDYSGSIPVKTLNNGDVVIELADGTTPSQKLAVNSAGSAQVAGQGVAGTPAGGVVSIQGVSGGTVVPVSGTVTVTDPAEGAVGSAPPSEAIYIGALASTSSPSLTTGDMYSLSLTLAGAVRVDGSAVTQPVSGTVTANQGGAPWSQNLTQVGGVTLALGQTTMSASLPVAIASNQSVLSVKDASDGPVSAGAAASNSSLVGAVYNTTLPSLTNGQQAALQVDATGKLLVDGSTVTQPVSGTVTANQGGAPWSQNLTQVGGSTIALGQTTMSASLPVAIASNQSALPSNITQIGGSSPSASNSLSVQISTGSAFVSGTNPLPVTIDPAALGTPKNYYTDSSSIAAGSSSTQSTTVGGTTGFYIQQVQCASSGKCKAIVQIETASGSGIFNVNFAGFNSVANPNIVFEFPSPTLVPTGARVQVVMTNNDVGATDLYSTVSGYQI